MTVLVAIVMFMAMMTGSAAAEPESPRKTLTYQGILTDSTSGPVNSERQLTFRLFNEEMGVIPIYTESQTVNVRDGLFSVQLGSNGDLDDVPFDEQYWLAILDEGSPVGDRIMLTAAPYVLGGVSSVEVLDPAVGGRDTLLGTVTLRAGSNIQISASESTATIAANGPFAQSLPSDGSGSLQPFDVAVWDTIDAVVKKSNEGDSLLVVGVVQSILPGGGSARVVTSGVVMCKVTGGEIEPGSTLVTATGGRAKRATTFPPVPGTVLGKALEAADQDATIRILVSLR
jgi:hypothetical protein